MKIYIDFEGLNKITCKLGLHRWYYEEYFSTRGPYTDYTNPVFRVCQDCHKEDKRIGVPSLDDEEVKT